MHFSSCVRIKYLGLGLIKTFEVLTNSSGWTGRVPSVLTRYRSVQNLVQEQTACTYGEAF